MLEELGYGRNHETVDDPVRDLRQAGASTADMLHGAYAAAVRYGVGRAELSSFFGKEVSRDLIGNLRSKS